MIAEDDYNEKDMFSTPSDPLTKYYRLPGVHVKLPTNGAFMPPGSIEFTMKGEVPVYPMRSADEMLLKSPDALMNGFAIEKLIQSCVPAVKKPRLVSSPDLDVLLIAIKAATTGEVMHLTVECPSCGKENEAYRNLSYLMANMTEVPPENPVRLNDDIVAYVRPHNMINATTLGIASFEEARKIQAMEAEAENVEGRERADRIAASMHRINQLSEETLADCVIRIDVPEGTVTDRVAIQAFLANISKVWTAKIRKKLEQINDMGIDKRYSVACSHCKHEWDAEIEFDPSTFFDSGSSE